MSSNCFTRFVMASPKRIAMPISVYPGLAMTKARVCDITTQTQAQVDAQMALSARYQTSVLLSAMDLSAEAEAFGCTLYSSESEVPSVTGRLITDMDQARKLAAPKPGDKRTGVYLEAVRQLRQKGKQHLVFGGCIGPFSLAARLVGVSEAMELTITEPDLMHLLLEKCSVFLTDYINAFAAAGANGVIMAEPAAGLLSPRGMSEYSSRYIKQIGTSVQTGDFALILHNCAAKVLHLPAVLETGLSAFHFGAPMDIPMALSKVPAETIICGNLDPSGVLCQSTPEEVLTKTKALLMSTASNRNFVLSSGCDLPPGTPLANLDAFYEAMK